MKKLILLIFFVLFIPLEGKCPGRFVNPVSDICWSCLFPITICGLKVSPNNEDTTNPKSMICTCGKPIPRVGLPISFWEPARLIDVTRVKFCLVSMGIQIGLDSIRGHGNVSLEFAYKKLEERK